MLPVVTESTISHFLESQDPTANVVQDIVAVGDHNPVLASFLATYIDQAGVEDLGENHPDVIETGAFIEGFLACYGLLASQATKDLLGEDWSPDQDEPAYDNL